MLAHTDLLAVLDGVSDACGLAALRADRHDLAGVDSAFGLDYAAGFALSAGLDVLGYEILTFNDDLVLLVGVGEHLAGVAAVA